MLTSKLPGLLLALLVLTAAQPAFAQAPAIPNEEILGVVPVVDDGKGIDESSSDFRIASAVAALGMRLRASTRQGENDFDLILDLAEPGLANDPMGYRKDFVAMVENIRKLEDR